MKIEKGVTRIVFVFKKFVIKVPNPTYCHAHFLNGCYANWSERAFCKTWKPCKRPNLYAKVAPVYFCSWFGLIQVQQRVQILDRRLTAREMKRFLSICTDNNGRNFGTLNGKIVCIDYP